MTPTGTVQIARRPAELVPLIQVELSAGAKHYAQAGALLLEAKQGLKHGEFQPWIKKNFKLSYMTATIYMRAAKSNARVTFREITENPSTRRNQPRMIDPEQAIEEAEERADRERIDARIRQITEEWERQYAAQRERAVAEVPLAAMLEIVASGYRALAKERHPDVGGSNVAMVRLTAARDRAVNLLNQYGG